MPRWQLKLHRHVSQFAYTCKFTISHDLGELCRHHVYLQVEGSIRRYFCNDYDRKFTFTKLGKGRVEVVGGGGEGAYLKVFQL